MSDAPPTPTPEELAGFAEQPPANIGQQLGLGSMWQPGPAGFGFHPAGLMNPDGSKVHIFQIAHVGGMTAMGMTDDDIRRLIKMCQERVSGLVLAGPSDALPAPGPLRTPGS